MNREHADKGFEIVSDTNVHTLNAYGFTVIAEATLNAVTHPSGYSSTGTLTGVALPVGYYPIKLTSIDLTSGKVICWLV